VIRLVLGLAPLAALVVSGAGGPARAFDRGADGEFEKRESSHFVLYQDVDIDETSGLRGSRRFEQNVLEVLEAAYDEADARLGLRPDGPITVVVYDPGVFDATFAGRFRFPVAGFYGGRVHVRGDTVMTARLARCLHHELVHAALDAEVRRGTLPAWLNEGVAEWFEARTTGERRLPGRASRTLSELARRDALYGLADLSAPSFAHLGPHGAATAYLQSRAFVDYLVALRGERALRDWIREIVRTGDVDRATRRTFRNDPVRLHREHLAALAGG
jgi:hypothetical protein